MGFVEMLVIRWRAFRFGDVMAVLLLAAILLIMFVALVEFPIFGWTRNWGFGPNWECSYPGKGEPVCLKNPKEIKGRGRVSLRQVANELEARGDVTPSGKRHSASAVTAMVA